MSNKKPSERVLELLKQLCEERKIDIQSATGNALFSLAITEYMDEEFEKNKPCEHEWNMDLTNLRRVICKKCKISNFLQSTS